MNNPLSVAFEEIAKISIYMQIPIVILIIFFSYQVYGITKINSYKYIFIAWLLNFVYLIFNMIIYYFNIEEHQTIPSIIGIELFNKIDLFYKNNKYLFYSICSTFDFLYMYFFFIAGFGIIKQRSIVNIFKNRKVKIIINYSFILLMLFFIVYKYLFIINNNGTTISYEHIPYYFRVSFPLVIFDIISLLVIMLYYKSPQSPFSKNHFIYYGFLIYLIIQFFGFFDNDNHNSIYVFGFVFSLVAKALILYGLHLFFIEHAKRMDILKNTLGSTFHDVNRLLNGAEEYVSLLAVHKANNKYVKRLESTFSEAYATFVAQKTLYEEALKTGIEFNRANLYTKVSSIVNDNNDSSSFELLKVNTLMQISIITLKKYFNKNIRIKTEYSSNCVIFANKNDVIRVFSNIIKNSIDELQHLNNGIIFIKTTSERIQLTNELIKNIIIEISDNGEGVSKEDLNKIFNAGFTTKKGLDRGYGLFIVRKIIEEKYNGKVEAISPYFNSTLKNTSGGFCIRILMPGV